MRPRLEFIWLEKSERGKKRRVSVQVLKNMDDRLRELQNTQGSVGGGVQQGQVHNTGGGSLRMIEIE